MMCIKKTSMAPSILRAMGFPILFVMAIALFSRCNPPLKVTANPPQTSMTVDKLAPSNGDLTLTDEGRQGQEKVEEFQKDLSYWWLGPHRVEQAVAADNPSKVKPTESMAGKSMQMFQDALGRAVADAASGTNTSGLELVGCGPSGPNLGWIKPSLQGAINDKASAVKECGYLVDPKQVAVATYFFDVREMGPGDRRGCITVNYRGNQENIQRPAIFCQKASKKLKKWIRLTINPDPMTNDSIQFGESKVSSNLYPSYENFDAQYGSMAAQSLLGRDENRPKSVVDIGPKYQDMRDGAIKGETFGNVINLVFLVGGIKGIISSWKELQHALARTSLEVGENGLKAAPVIKWWEYFKLIESANSTVFFTIQGLNAYQQIDAMPDSQDKQNLASAWMLWNDLSMKASNLTTAVWLYSSTRNFFLEGMLRKSLEKKILSDLMKREIPSDMAGKATNEDIASFAKEKLKAMWAWGKTPEGRPYVVQLRKNVFGTAGAGIFSSVLRPKTYGEQIEKGASDLYSIWQKAAAKAPAQ